ncbi:MAG: hypothetical protein AAGF47_11415 [Planctomycetota bacterium]
MTDPRVPTAAWLRADQTDLVRRVIADAGFELIAAGGDGGHELAAHAGARTASDLRALVASTDASLVLLGDPGPFADGARRDDFKTLLAAAQAGITIASLEPIPPLSLHLTDPAWRSASDVARERVVFTPLVRRGAAFRRAQDLLESFGPIDTVAIQTLGRGAEGSLGARLTGACDLLIRLLGMPLAVHAIHTPGPDDPPAPETLRGFRGHLAATFRFAEGQSASLFASDRAATWSRSLTLIGPGGRIVADDETVEWYDAAGLHVDSMTARHRETDDLAASVIADDLRAVMGNAPRTAPVDLGSVLATAHAGLLSARTGHAEQPEKIRRMGKG